MTRRVVDPHQLRTVQKNIDLSGSELRRRQA